MLAWLKRLAAPYGLARVKSKPKLVFVAGRITNDNATESPITGLRAAAFVWSLITRYDRPEPWLHNVERSTRHDHLATAVGGPELLVRTKWGLLLVQTEGLRARTSAIIEGIVPLDRPPPIPALVPAYERSSRAVSIQEIALSRGDLVEVTGYVQRLSSDADGSAYRARADVRPDFVTRPDLGPVELEDRSLVGPR